MLVHNSIGRAFNVVLVVLRVAVAFVVETVLARNGGLENSNDVDFCGVRKPDDEIIQEEIIIPNKMAAVDICVTFQGS